MQKTQKRFKNRIERKCMKYNTTSDQKLLNKID